MIKPEQVPDAAWRIACDVLGDLNVYQNEMREAIAAALNAWPGASTGPNVYHRQDAIIHLPLPQQKESEE